MFVGHLSVALATNATSPRIPLWSLVAASFGLDLLWPMLLLAGIETVRVDPGNTAFTPLAFDSYPWSHSLVMVTLWSTVAAFVAFKFLGDKRGAAIIGLVVASHWFLDLITHRPDLPLWPGGQTVGLGLWDSIPGTLVVEGAMLAASTILYLRSTRPLDRVGRWAFWGLVALTVAIWASQPWSPPAPDPIAVAIVTMTLWLLPPWTAWIERHRTLSNGGQNAR
jgi:membrane-bound metal-dependent hydrolase YbcI (DUF457 family)